ncbi:MAG: GGDEF domain-containing protein, partial [Planctomycetaceae bacterium]
MKTDLVKRAALLGGIAWASLCLLTVGLAPSLQPQLSQLWIISGLMGLASALGLLQVVKRDDSSNKAELVAASRPASRIDSLTGLPNRWEFDRLINIMIADAQDHQLPLSLLLIDVDQMQEINQREGYMGGDEVLCKVTRSIIKALRGADLVCRYHHDDFAAVLADLDARSCSAVVDRLRG